MHDAGGDSGLPFELVPEPSRGPSDETGADGEGPVAAGGGRVGGRRPERAVRLGRTLGHLLAWAAAAAGAWAAFRMERGRE